MGFVLVQRDGGSGAHLGLAAFGADDDVGLDGFRLAIVEEGDRWRVPERDDIDRHRTEGFCAGGGCGVVKCLAMKRMAEAERAGHIGGEDAEGKRSGFAHRGREAFVIGDMVGDVVAAGRHQEVVEAEAPGFGDAPGGDPFAAHAVFVVLGFLEKQNLASVAGHDNGEGAAANPAANDDQIVSHGLSPPGGV